MNFAELMAFFGRNPLLSAAFVGLSVAIIVTELARRGRGFKAIGINTLTTLVNQENALLVDLRPIADFDKGHIPGAKNVQMSQFDPENKQLKSAKSLPVVMICKTGMTATSAAARLHKAGFERVYVLDGGMVTWQQANLPLVKGRK